MTLIIQKPTGAKLNLRQTWQPMDPDAAAYITAVETADGQALEEKTKIAIDNFVLGCKADGIWNAIKASCILAGARTLNGALVPLAGAAPTNFNFVSGNYNRKTGLVGDGTSKYLDTNRNGFASNEQNNYHCSVFVSQFANTEPVGAFGPFIAARLPDSATGNVVINNVNDGATPRFDFIGNDSLSSIVSRTPRTSGKLAGLSRPESSSYSTILNNSVQSHASTSVKLAGANWTIFVRSPGGSGQKFGASRLAFYSIGEALDLQKLDTRVTDLINAFGAAIP